jgi:hypothetical protein
MKSHRVLTFSGKNKEFGEYLNFIKMYCELNPDITLGQFAWRNHGRNHPIAPAKYVWTNGANDV